MWAAADHFHYVWKKVSGDVLLDATVEFAGPRPATGTPECASKSVPGHPAVARFRLGLRGRRRPRRRTDVASVARREGCRHARSPIERRPARRGSGSRSAATTSRCPSPAGEPLHPAGGAARVEFTGEFYVGLGVPRTTPRRIETGVFSNVELGTPPPATGRTTLVNTLETISLRSRRSTRGLRGHAARPHRGARTGFPTTRTRCTSTTAASCTRYRRTRRARRRTRTG